MNKQQFAEILCDTNETRETVSQRLHEDIMRSVRVNGTANGKVFFSWRKPAWGAAAVLASFMVLLLSQTTMAPDPVQPGISNPQVTIQSMSSTIQALSKKPLLHEEELKLELERLKSDLQRFDFRS